MNFFERLPKSVLFLMICASLLLNVVNFGASSQFGKDAHRDDLKVCRVYLPTTNASNTINGLFHDLIQGQMNNALNRIGTAKELPSDKATVKKDQKYLDKFIVVATPNCEKVLR